MVKEVRIIYCLKISPINGPSAALKCFSANLAETPGPWALIGTAPHRSTLYIELI